VKPLNLTLLTRGTMFHFYLFGAEGAFELVLTVPSWRCRRHPYLPGLDI